MLGKTYKDETTKDGLKHHVAFFISPLDTTEKGFVQHGLVNLITVTRQY